MILVWQFRGLLSTVFKFGFGSAVLQTRYIDHTNKGNVTGRQWGIFADSNCTVSLTANICLQTPAHIPRVLGFVNIVWWWHTENYESVSLYPHPKPSEEHFIVSDCDQEAFWEVFECLNSKLNRYFIKNKFLSYACMKQDGHKPWGQFWSKMLQK